MQTVKIDPWKIGRVSPVDDFSETIFFIGNGTLGVRGFGAWEAKRSPQAHAVFRAGLFSEIKPGITDMVQLPDALTLRPLGEEPQMATQTLDLRTGVLTQCWETERAALCMQRMASMANRQLLIQRLQITAKRAGAFTVEAVANAEVKNLPIHDDQTVTATEHVRLLKAVSLTENAMRLHTLHEGAPVEINWEVTDDREANRRDYLERSAAFTALTDVLAEGETWTVEKRVRILMQDEAVNPETADPWGESIAVWRALWDDCDVEIESSDEELQGALRYCVFQLLCNNAAGDRSVSIGARGMSHGRYKGNTFWDTEIFMLPFYMWTRPQAAKSLLLYRTDRLDDARTLAKKQNLDGARFPWMCSKTGLEQCETWDIGLCEVHVTADVAYAAQRYAETTGDEEFLRGPAAELFSDTARYWLSRLTYEPAKDRYSSFFVKGPDEYCGAAVNNTFTNYMARRNVHLALQYGTLNPEERKQARFTAERIELLYDAGRDLYLQDELLDRLEPLPFVKSADEPSYKYYCYDRMQRYRVLKQADLVLLMNLFPADFTKAQKRNVFDYYEPITLHDSTLSYGPHAQLALTLGLWDKAEEYLRKAVYLDLKDIMGNTGREGLHLAAMGSAWQVLVFGAAGLWAENGELTMRPMLPPSVRRIRFTVFHRGRRYRVEATREGHLVREEG